MSGEPIRRETSVWAMAYANPDEDGFWTRRAAARFAEAGFETLGDLADAPWADVKRAAGSKGARDGAAVVRRHILDRDRPLGERILLEDDEIDGEEEPDSDGCGVVSMGVMLSPENVVRLERILEKSGDLEAPDVLAELRPYVEQARETLAVTLDPQADAVEWREVEAGYKIRTDACDPDYMDPVVRVHRRWDAEIFGLKISVVMTAMRHVPGRYAVFKDIDGPEGRFLHDAGSLADAKRTAYWKARAQFPARTPLGMTAVGRPCERKPGDPPPAVADSR